MATFVGVPSIIVNTDVVKNPPKTWDDLLKPEYKGLIGVSDPATSGTGGATGFSNGSGSISQTLLVGMGVSTFVRACSRPST